MSNIDTRWEQALLNKITSNGERIAVIERDVKDIKSELTTLNSKVSDLDSKVSNLDIKVSDLNSKTTNIDKRLSNVEMLINDIKKIMMWIVGGIGAIILSLIANLIYANFI